MTSLIQKLFAMVLLALGIGFIAPSLLTATGPEPADGVLLICGLVIGLFIAWQRLNDERLIS